MKEKVYSGTLELGNTIIFCDRMWIICHIDGDKYYLAAKHIDSYVTFGCMVNDYNKSNLAKVVVDYQKELEDQYPQEVKEHLIPVMVNGFTSKVFVPSKEQMEGENGGFSYFNSNERRRCESNEDAKWVCHDPYWTSSLGLYGGAWCVYTDGGLSDNIRPRHISCFRPFICFKP